MDKLNELKETLKSYGKIAIAYSGGCDSNFLMNVAVETLGYENVFCVLCVGAMMSDEDLENARTLLQNIQHVEVEMNVFDVPEFLHNNKNRCYYCKKTIMSKVIQVALENGFIVVTDGKNADDEKVYRPGIQACLELGIVSPLALAGFCKSEIRECSRQLGIVTYDKPANACLASRFPYDTLLTPKNLTKVAKAEALLHKRGLHRVRVRVHDRIARIEIEKEKFSQLLNDQQLIDDFKQLGFDFITLDLEGITSGSYDR